MELKEEWKQEDRDEDGEDIISYERYFMLLSGCCEQSKKSLRPFYMITECTDDVKTPEGLAKIKGKWTIPHVDWEYIQVFAYSDESYIEEGESGIKVYHPVNKKFDESEAPVKYCPYCGTKMPEVKLKDNFTEPVITDGNGHCMTCNERYGKYGSCDCWPQEILFEVVENGKDE